MLTQSRRHTYFYDLQGPSTTSALSPSSPLACPALGTLGSLLPLPSRHVPALSCSLSWPSFFQAAKKLHASLLHLSYNSSRMSHTYIHSFFQAPSWLCFPLSFDQCLISISYFSCHLWPCRRLGGCLSRSLLHSQSLEGKQPGPEAATRCACSTQEWVCRFAAAHQPWRPCGFFL